MSHIPSKAMHHAHAAADAGTDDMPANAGEPAKAHPQPASRPKPAGWMIGAAALGGVAIVASLLALRSSTPAKPVKRPRRRTAKPPAKQRPARRKAD